MLVFVPAIMGLVSVLLAFMVAQFWTGETVLGACMGVAMLAASLFSVPGFIDILSFSQHVA